MFICTYRKWTANRSGTITSKAIHPIVENPVNTQERMTIILAFFGTAQIAKVLKADITIENAIK